MRAIAPTMNIVLLALFLAITVSPLQNLLMKYRVKQGLAVAITLVVILISGYAIISLMVGTVTSLIERMPEYRDRLASLMEGGQAFLVSKGVDPAKVLPSGAMDPSTIVEYAGAFLQSAAGALGNGFFLMILMVIMLIELATVHVKTLKGEYAAGTLMHTFSEIGKDTSKFMGISAAVGFVQAVLNTIALLVLGVDFAATWGILFFFFNFIPVVGFLLGIVPPFLMALLDGGVQQAVGVLISWWILNVLFDNVIRPKFLKKGFDVSILTIMLSLIFWSFVLGPLGAILGVPLTQSIKKLLPLLTDEV
jgi:predicted PurR-regulated permease PerM